MFEVRRPKEKHITIIRNVTPRELANYEKWKLEKSTQVDKLEMIRVETPFNKLEEQNK